MNATNERRLIAGHWITIRPMHASDAAMEQEFVEGLSDETRHFRFLGAVKELSAAELAQLCNIDGQHNMAFAATLLQDGHEKLIGVSRYADCAKSGVRELAVTVADGWQHHGLGGLLARHLIDYARSHGIKRLYSVDLADNSGMRHLAHDLGMGVCGNPDDPREVIYSLQLSAAETATAK